MTRTVYHLASSAGWDEAQRRGVYAGTADDARDGFIHCSTAAQVAESAARHRAGRTDVVLLTIDAAALGAALRWEPSRGGALFPHVYAPLPLTAVRRAEALPLGPDGRHVFPPLREASVLTVPGWGGSGPEHWQTQWERAHGYGRVEQADWEQPDLETWAVALERAVAAAAPPVVLVGHSLGCVLVVHWAMRHGSVADRVTGAVLVAPADVDMLADLNEAVQSFTPVPLDPLPFPAVVIASRDDPYADFARAERFAAAWRARLVDAGLAGHLNAESQLGAWPFGHDQLRALLDAVCG